MYLPASLKHWLPDKQSCGIFLNMKRVAQILLLLAVTASSLYAQTQPKFVTYFLAGRDIRDGKKSKGLKPMTAICDKKKGFCLVNDNDSEESKNTYSLLLISARELKGEIKQSPEIWKNLNIYSGVLPSLSTGHGISIGDTKKALTKRLGKPTIIYDGDVEFGEQLFLCD